MEDELDELVKLTSQDQLDRRPLVSAMVRLGDKATESSWNVSHSRGPDLTHGMNEY